MRELHPIGIKRHRLTPRDRVSRLILVERDPVEAILSHKRQVDASEDALLVAYAWWSELRLIFEDFNKSDRLLIRFEDILEGNSVWIAQIGQFLGLSPTAADVVACARALPQGKEVLLRAAQTTCATTYRDKFPQKAAMLDRLIETR